MLATPGNFILYFTGGLLMELYSFLEITISKATGSHGQYGVNVR